MTALPPPHFTLTQLHAFVETVAHGSFASAARILGSSQQAASDLVRRLEAELDAPVFRRGSRGLELTSAGRQLLPHATRTLKAALDAQEAISSLHALASGHATFGVLKNADLYLGAELAARFRRQYPNVRITLTGQNSTETARSVSSGVLEAGLVSLPVDVSGLEVLPVVQDEIVYVSVDPARTSEPPTVAQISRGPLVLYDAHFSTTDPLRRQLNEGAQTVGLRIEPTIDVEHLSTALSLVSAGVGDSIVPRAAINDDLLCADICFTELREPMFEVLAFIKRRDDRLTSATRELVRLSYEILLESQAGSPQLTPLATDRDIIDFLA